MKNSFTKKIISGKFKGKTIELPSLESTRSSKTIVLESFFNTIQFEVMDTAFVEVFAGSGSVGLEALSRGASRIYFMEKDKSAIKTLEKNIYQTDPSRCEIYRGDSFENIKKVIRDLDINDNSAFFYIDPPFSYRDGMEDIYNKTIRLIKNLPQDLVKLIVIEHMSALDIPENIGLYTLSKTKKFGKTSLSYYI